MKERLSTWFEKYRSNVITPVVVTIASPISFALGGFVVSALGILILILLSLLTGGFDFIERIIGNFWSITKTVSIGSAICSVFFIVAFYRLYFSKT